MKLDPSQVHAVTACFYPNEQPIDYLKRSCGHFGIELHTYGRGQEFVSWRHAKMRLLADYLETVDRERYSHFLYTDGADSWFVRDLNAVVEAYGRVAVLDRERRQLVISAERTCYPHGDLHIHFPQEELVGPWRFPNAGQFMGEIEFGIELLRWLDKKYGDYDSYNDQSAWLHWFAANGTNGPVAIDHDCELFLSMASSDWFKGCPYPGFDDSGPYVTLRVPPSFTRPCLIHFNGGGGKQEMLDREWNRLTKGAW